MSDGAKWWKVTAQNSSICDATCFDTRHMPRETLMPTHLVNLDALIQREDFEQSADARSTVGDQPPQFKLLELEIGAHYLTVLRKPDFQRETSNWSPEMTVDFIESFLDYKLIPSIIIWHSKETGRVFIIDGAHRISALIAWVNDDYGNGVISQKFYGSSITKAQIKYHNETQELVRDRIGEYKILVSLLGVDQDGGLDKQKLRRARTIATRSLHIQSVEGDAEIAEQSFFKINGKPTVIDPTELDVLRARRKPNAIATRALMRGGSAQKYPHFSQEIGKQINSTAKRVYDLVFGQFTEIVSQSPDVPRAGQPYSSEAFKMMLDMVNVFNDINDPMWQDSTRTKNTTAPELPDDIDGLATLGLLNRLETIGRTAFSNDYAGSLGLDSVVYSYGSTGKLHHAAFLASLKFATELHEKNLTYQFTQVRERFEEFLIVHKSFLNDLSHSKGSRTRSLEPIMVMHRTVLMCLLDGMEEDKHIVAKLMADPQLRGLKDVAPISSDGSDSQPAGKKRSKGFSKTAEAIGIIRELLKSRARCAICHARLPPYARSKDHIIPAADGGNNHSDNLQFTHPYCNSGFKTSESHRKRMAKNAGAS